MTKSVLPAHNDIFFVRIKSSAILRLNAGFMLNDNSKAAWRAVQFNMQWRLSWYLKNTLTTSCANTDNNHSNDNHNSIDDRKRYDWRSGFTWLSIFVLSSPTFCPLITPQWLFKGRLINTKSKWTYYACFQLHISFSWTPTK